jgi:hypothetical protein
MVTAINEEEEDDDDDAAPAPALEAAALTVAYPTMREPAPPPLEDALNAFSTNATSASGN